MIDEVHAALINDLDRKLELQAERISMLERRIARLEADRRPTGRKRR